MLVILKENVDNLGIIGDTVRVTNGYARNYLIPRRLAIVANQTNIKELEHHKRSLEVKRLAQKSASQELAQKLAEHSCTLKRKVGKNDKLFGSVTSADVAEELQKAGFKIDKTAVQIKEPLKALGVHEVPVRIQSDVTAHIKVWIVKEESTS